MKIKDIIFLKANDNQVSAHLYFSTEEVVCDSMASIGVSRKQAIFNLCKQGQLDWSLFAEAKALALTKKDPRFQKVKSFNKVDNRREQKLADICDDMRCSRSEAVAFLDCNTSPLGW
jgi:hypothetical protein